MVDRTSPERSPPPVAGESSGTSSWATAEWNGTEAPDPPLRAFVEQMQEGALTLSREGSVLYANDCFARLAGVPLAEIVGAPLAIFVSPGDRSAVAALVREGVEGTVRGACRLGLGEREVPVQLTLSPLAGGPRPACCAIVVDLREREREEEARAARVAADEVSKAKDQFLALVSHELRSPLNGILGWAQILVDDPSLSDTVRRAVETIERSARAQAGLITDLLDISRIVAGKLTLEMSHSDLAEIATSAIAAVQPVAEAKGVVLRHLVAGGADVYGDPTRLEQVVTILLTHALDCTPAHGTIDVTLDGQRDSIVLEVRDTGAGMSPTQVQRAFDVFQQGEAPRRKSRGLGLGLAIARRLAEAHDGTLTVSSDGEGRGSLFTVRLPRAMKSARPAGAPDAQKGQLVGIAALVVDDDRDNLELLTYLLETAGCEVTTAECAEDALTALGRADFGLIVSDIGLPDRDGLELLREIRARGYDAAKLPAIALTGYAGLHDARLVSAAGYQKHLAKPVDIPSLLASAEQLGRRT